MDGLRDYRFPDGATNQYDAPRIYPGGPSDAALSAYQTKDKELQVCWEIGNIGVCNELPGAPMVVHIPNSIHLNRNKQSGRRDLSYSIYVDQSPCPTGPHILSKIRAGFLPDNGEPY